MIKEQHRQLNFLAACPQGSTTMEHNDLNTYPDQGYA